MKTLKLKLGASPKQMLESLKDYNVSSWAKDIILKIKPVKKEVEVAILTLDDLELPEYSTTQEIRDKAKSLGYETPDPEVAIELRKALSDEDIKDMGLWWIITMHKPIKDSGGGLGLLDASRSDDGRWLSTYYDRPDSRWVREDGFAFVVSQSPLKLSPKDLDALPLELEIKIGNKTGKYKLIK